MYEMILIQESCWKHFPIGPLSRRWESMRYTLQEKTSLRPFSVLLLILKSGSRPTPFKRSADWRQSQAALDALVEPGPVRRPCLDQKSAGPGTRANIDEFTETTSKAIELIGGVANGKAIIIIMNPAEPPLMMMRDTVFVLSEAAGQAVVQASIEEIAAAVQAYVPGYRLKQRVQFDVIPESAQLHIPGLGTFSGLKTSAFLEVEGAAHYLPDYAGTSIS